MSSVPGRVTFLAVVAILLPCPHIGRESELLSVCLFLSTPSSSGVSLMTSADKPLQHTGREGALVCRILYCVSYCGEYAAEMADLELSLGIDIILEYITAIFAI